MPSGTVEISGREGFFLDNASIERWTVKKPGGLSGGTITISGLSATLTDVLVRLENLDGSVEIARLTPSKPSYVISASPAKRDTAITYVKLGIEHILQGLDHLLFVLVLIIVAGGTVTLLKAVTAFTIAHSITLSLAVLGFVKVPQAPVEAAILLSIIFGASEIIRSQEGKRGLADTFPWLIAFVFGLLHGFGFAGALSEIGLPQRDIPLALFSFNIGVELGQLIFIAAVLCTKYLVSGLFAPKWAFLTSRLLLYGIGSISTAWLFARLAQL
jgi:hypothetical protein